MYNMANVKKVLYINPANIIKISKVIIITTNERIFTLFILKKDDVLINWKTAIHIETIDNIPYPNKR